jgi:superfamily I DNA and/or RNA helicase
VDSIDRIQGQESDLVLLSFCRTRRGRQGAGFGLWLQDVRRLNVACTRARRGLVLVGHRRTLERLSGIPAAQEFYRNLFDVFDSSAETLTLKDLR